jgi:hypothetical protein
MDDGLMAMENDRLAELHHLLLSRIYHEDILLAQRTYNFLTANAFLAAALAFVGFDATSGLPAYIVTCLGVIVALMQIALGFRSERAILFWRRYVELIEPRRDLLLETAFYEFNRDGRVKLLEGIIEIPEGGRRISGAVPWSWKLIESANVLVGVTFPLLLLAFWLISLNSLLVERDHLVTALVVDLAAVAMFVAGRRLAVPSRPLAIWTGGSPNPADRADGQGRRSSA